MARDYTGRAGTGLFFKCVCPVQNAKSFEIPKPRRSIDKHGEVFLNFLPAISNAARHKIRAEIRGWNRNYWVPLTLEQIAEQIIPVIQGWINCYGRYNPGVLKDVLKHVNDRLVRWGRRKFKGLRKRKTEAVHRLGDIALQKPNLFYCQ
jgi:RNA-directed DNA polymerase